MVSSVLNSTEKLCDKNIACCTAYNACLVPLFRCIIAVRNTT